MKSIQQLQTDGGRYRESLLEIDDIAECFLLTVQNAKLVHE